MAEICPVCGEEITSENREVYKSINDPEGLVLHDYCLTKYVSKPEKYGGKVKTTDKTEAQIRADWAGVARARRRLKTEDKSVHVKSFDMPFGDMVGFMVKWALASIPAFIILFIIFGIFFLIFGSLFF